MINAEIIDWWIDDFPKASEPNMILMTATIGQRGMSGGNNFNLVVCTPSWVAELVKGTRGFWPRGYLIVDRIDPEHVERAVEALIEHFSWSETWEQFCERINRYTQWEYEDFNEGKGGVPQVPN